MRIIHRNQFSTIPNNLTHSSLAVSWISWNVTIHTFCKISEINLHLNPKLFTSDKQDKQPHTHSKEQFRDQTKTLQWSWTGNSNISFHSDSDTHFQLLCFVKRKSRKCKICFEYHSFFFTWDICGSCLLCTVVPEIMNSVA